MSCSLSQRYWDPFSDKALALHPLKIIAIFRDVRATFENTLQSPHPAILKSIGNERYRQIQRLAGPILESGNENLLSQRISERRRRKSTRMDIRALFPESREYLRSHPLS